MFDRDVNIFLQTKMTTNLTTKQEQRENPLETQA